MMKSDIPSRWLRAAVLAFVSAAVLAAGGPAQAGPVVMRKQCATTYDGQQIQGTLTVQQFKGMRKCGYVKGQQRCVARGQQQFLITGHFKSRQTGMLVSLEAFVGPSLRGYGSVWFNHQRHREIGMGIEVYKRGFIARAEGYPAVSYRCR